MRRVPKEDVVSQVTRRQFLFLVPATIIAVACDKVSPTAPPTGVAQPVPLLQLLQATGYNAEARPFGAGRIIAINGSVRWNFKVNGEIIGIGPANAPTLDVTSVLIKPTDNWSLTPA